MRTIYDIQDDIREIFEKAIVDEETGELAVDIAALDALQLEEEEKLKAWGIWLKGEIAWADALYKEAKRIADDLDRQKKKIDRIKEKYMYVLGGRTLKTPEVSARYHTTKNVVEIADDAQLGDEWMTIKTTKTVSKTKLKEAILEGEIVPGVKLVDKVSLVVK